jgi:predicted dinucleotide-binding enzyme
MRIGIIGAGNAGGTLGTLWQQRGHAVTFGVRDPSSERVQQLVRSTGARALPVREAVQDAEVVVLATPWQAARDALAAAGDLAGRVLIDCTNPLGRNMLPDAGDGISAAEHVAAWAPGARVVKAFNTIGANMFANPIFDGRHAALFICGDDADALSIVSGLAGELGFEPVESGPLQNARLTEPVAALWIWLAMHRLGREFAFGILRR